MMKIQLKDFAALAVVPVLLLGVAACGGQDPEPEAPIADVDAPVDGADEAASEVSEMAAAVETRQKKFKQLGKNFKTISDNAKAGTPASDDALAAIETVGKLAPKLKSWFPEGSGPEAGVETEALPAIWTDAEGFAAATAEFETAVATLVAAGASADGDAIKTAFGNVGKTCGSCHDNYRED